MKLEKKHLLGRPAKVGRVKDSPVFHVVTTGGLHLIAMTNGGDFETLGAGSHPAIARHLARKAQPELVWTQLEKADHVEPEHFADLLPRYEMLTALLNRR